MIEDTNTGRAAWRRFTAAKDSLHQRLRASESTTAYPTNTPGTESTLALVAPEPANGGYGNPYEGFSIPVPQKDPIGDFIETFLNNKYSSSLESLNQRPAELLQKMIDQILYASINMADELYRYEQPRSRKSFLKKMTQKLLDSPELGLRRWPIVFTVHMFGKGQLIESILTPMWSYFQALKGKTIDLPTAYREIEKQLRDRGSWMERLLRDVSLRESLSSGIFSTSGTLKWRQESLNGPNPLDIDGSDLEKAGIEVDVMNVAQAIENRAAQVAYAVPPLEMMYRELFGETLTDARNRLTAKRRKNRLSQSEYDKRMYTLLKNIHQPNPKLWQRVFKEYEPDIPSIHTSTGQSRKTLMGISGSIDSGQTQTPKYKSLEWRSRLLLGFKKTSSGIDIVDINRNGHVPINFDGTAYGSVTIFENGRPISAGQIYESLSALKDEYLSTLLGSTNSPITPEQSVEKYEQLIENRASLASFLQKLHSNPKKNKIICDKRQLKRYIRKYSGFEPVHHEKLYHYIQSLAQADFSFSLQYLPISDVHGGEFTASLGFGQGDTILHFNEDSNSDKVSRQEVSNLIKSLRAGDVLTPTRMTQTWPHVIGDGANAQANWMVSADQLAASMAELDIAEILEDRNRARTKGLKRTLTESADNQIGKVIQGMTVVDTESIYEVPPPEFTQTLPSLPGKLIASPEVHTDNLREALQHTHEVIVFKIKDDFIQAINDKNLGELKRLGDSIQQKWLKQKIDDRLVTVVEDNWLEIVRRMGFTSQNSDPRDLLAAKNEFIRGRINQLRQQVFDSLMEDPQNSSMWSGLQAAIDQVTRNRELLAQQREAFNAELQNLKRNIPSVPLVSRILGKRQESVQQILYEKRKKDLELLYENLSNHWIDTSKELVKPYLDWYVSQTQGQTDSAEELARIYKYVTVNDELDQTRKGELLLGKMSTFGLVTFAEVIAEAVRRSSGEFDVMYGGELAVSTVRTVVGLATLPDPYRLGMADAVGTKGAVAALQALIREWSYEGDEYAEERVVLSWQRYLHTVTEFAAVYYQLQVHLGRNGVDSASLATITSGRFRERLLKWQVEKINAALAKGFFPSILISAQHDNSKKGGTDRFTTSPAPAGEVRDGIAVTYDHAKDDEKLTFVIRHIIKLDELDNLARSKGYYNFNLLNQFGKKTSANQKEELLKEYKALKEREAMYGWMWQIAIHTLTKLKDGDMVAQYFNKWRQIPLAERQKVGNNFMNFVVTDMAINLGLSRESIREITGKNYLDFRNHFSSMKA